MTAETLEKVEIENYGCIRQQSFSLSPLHCFIGPNDSGKSTILHAVRLAAQLAASHFEGPDKWSPFEPFLYTGAGSILTLHYPRSASYRLSKFPERVTKPGDRRTSIEVREQASVGANSAQEVSRSPVNLAAFHGEETTAAEALKALVTLPTMVRFDPDALRTPAAQILAGSPVAFEDETGRGLASVYQAINSRQVDTFVEIRNKVRILFPHVQDLLVPTVANNQVLLQAKLTDGQVVPAKALSEGLLYFLGFTALQYLDNTRLFLVEEPENGLHPTRIAEVMTVLRELSQTSQILIATHSPLVVNELQGNEVTVVTRDEDKGAQGTLLKDVPGFDKAMKVYSPGEFWLSYADGQMEEPLLKGKPRQ